MPYSLDQVIERAAGLEDGTRNSLVHLAAQSPLADGRLTLIRLHTEASGAAFDVYRDEHTGKAYVTRRPELSPRHKSRLRKRLEEMVGPLRAA